MAGFDRLATLVTEHSGAVIAVMVLLTAVFGAGLGAIEQSSAVDGLSSDSETASAFADVQENFSGRGANTTTTLVAVRSPEGNVLSKASLVRSLRFQHRLRKNETLNATLPRERPTVAVANVVARMAVRQERRQQRQGNGSVGVNDTNATTGPPSLERQIATLESMEEAAVEETVRRALDPEEATPASRLAYRLLPRSYDPGSASASARLVVVTQQTDGYVQEGVALSESVTAGQAAARSLAEDTDGPETYHVYSRGLVSRQQQQAIGDSLAILGPLALVFVLVSLSIAYRNPVDVLVGLVGVGVVLVWTLGGLGWLGVPFNQTMIAVPILLIGLSVDYALHVVMRYREERHGDGQPDARTAMHRSLVGVGPALVLVTATTAVGFLANLTSPMGDIQAFGVVTAWGITATLAVFGLLVPALKTVVQSALDSRGYDCTPTPPGTGGSAGRVLETGASIARCAPLAMVLLALLVGAGGAYAGTHVDVSSEQSLFMADDPPAWTEDAPEAVQPGEYFLKENRRYVLDTFQSPERQGYVLVEGNVTAPGTLAGVAAAQQQMQSSSVAVERPTGEPAVQTPLSAMHRVAERNDSFNATLTGADTDGDGVPDRNVERVYDAFYATAPDLAASTVSRTDDGEYTALRLRMGLDAADRDAAVAPLTAAAGVFDGDDVQATATGQAAVSKELNDRLATTMVQSLGVTLAVVLTLLAVVFRRREGSASLGAVTLAPVAISVSWLLGTMALLDIPISVVSSLVGGLAVGLGVDYAIHVSERFAQERREGAGTDQALARTVAGTGSALFSSAFTTAAGFGVLSFALLPALRQFGFILAIGIVYAFVASVFVQPSLLALWARYGPGTTAPRSRAPVLDD